MPPPDARRSILLPVVLAVCLPHPGATADEPLPPAAISRLGGPGPRGFEFVSSVAFSPDGKLLAFDCWRDVYVVKAATGQQVWELRGHANGVAGVGFAPDGKSLASGSRDGRVKFWDLATGKQVREFAASESGDCSFALSRDGKAVAVGEGRGGVAVWDAETGKRRWHREAHRGGRPFVGFSDDGRRLASGGPDGVARVWDAATGKEQLTLTGHKKPVSCVLFSPGRDTLLTCAGDGTARGWDGTTGKELRSFGGHPGGIDGATLSPDGKVLVTAGEDGKLRRWDTATGRPLGSVTHRAVTCSAAFTPDGKTLASAGWDGLRLWDAVAWKELDTPPGHQAPLIAVAFSPDGKSVVTASEDYTVRLWTARTGGEVVASRLSIGPVARVSFAADGKALLTGGRDFRPHRWELPQGKEVPLPLPPTEMGPPLAFSAGGRLLVSEVTGTQHCTLLVWDVGEGKQVAKLSGWGPCAFSPDGRHLAYQGRYSHLYVAALDSQQEPTTLQWGLTSAWGIAFSPDGRTVAASFPSEGRTVIGLWEARTGKSRGRFEAERAGERMVLAFTRDGRHLASGDDGGMVAVRDAATGKEVWSERGHRSEIGALAFSPDGALLVSGGRDATAVCWDVAKMGGKGARPPALEAARAAALWDALGAEDAAVAYRAVLELAASPAEAAALLKDRLRPVAVVDDGTLARWVRDLDNDDFKVRERATEGLGVVGSKAEAALRRALRETASLEVRTRAEELLKKLGGKEWTAEDRRTARAVEALDLIGTAETRRRLEELSKGEPASRVTREAAAAVRGWERR